MEEDIKILEERIDYFKCHPEGCNWRLSFEDEKDIKALENLIKGYREYKNFYHRRLKEWRTKFENQEKHFLNELDEYDEEREKLKKQLENCIPKSKIKEKIQELEELLKDFEQTDNTGRFKREKSRDYDKLLVLQELMEDK